MVDAPLDPGAMNLADVVAALDAEADRWHVRATISDGAITWLAVGWVMPFRADGKARRLRGAVPFSGPAATPEGAIQAGLRALREAEQRTVRR